MNGDQMGDIYGVPTGRVPRVGPIGHLIPGTPTTERPGLSREEPPPRANTNPAVWPMVIKDMAERDLSGRQKYGTPLQPHNGRDALVDAYQEALDLVVYLRQAIYERDATKV